MTKIGKAKAKRKAREARKRIGRLQQLAQGLYRMRTPLSVVAAGLFGCVVLPDVVFTGELAAALFQSATVGAGAFSVFKGVGLLAEEEIARETKKLRRAERALLPAKIEVVDDE